MSPLEQAIRAVCSHIGADPDGWRGFEELGRKAVEALVAALPADVAEALRRALEPGEPS